MSSWLVDPAFWSGRRVFITGHTGFKGAWLCCWLHSLGANVSGYALLAPTEPSLFDLAGVADLVDHHLGDVRDAETLTAALLAARPEVVIHMAAQPLVRESYRTPAETYAVNVMGSVHLLEAVRKCPEVRAVVNVTTDKCYENREWVWGYRENEALGGHDPYSSSKACSELLTASWRRSFFSAGGGGTHPAAVASARAGNVIGGGDWACDRLIPDCLQALIAGERVRIRNPRAIRPWQHVLEPLSGYLLLAQSLISGGETYAGAWNFGPRNEDARPVEWIVQRICSLWGGSAAYDVDTGVHPHEAHYLKLDCSRAGNELGWAPRWTLERALESIVCWTQAWQSGRNMQQVCLEQIRSFNGNDGVQGE